MIHISEDSKYTVCIGNKLIQKILGHIKQAGSIETGGIVVGNYSSDRSIATVRNLTGPPPDSRHGATWFERGLKGLQQLLNGSWTKREYYLGEWHFHPRAAPNPSHQDIRQMREISNSNSYKCPEPILLIIGGDFVNYDIKVFIAIRNGKFIELKSKDH